MIFTRSMFYYGFSIPAQFNLFSFQEATGSVRTAFITARAYTLTQAATELARALNAAGSQVYTVELDRVTRQITISAPANFSILIDGGPYAGSPIFNIFGLGDTDLTGTNTYTGLNPIGKVYMPQIPLLDYQPTKATKRAIDATINESGNAGLEVIRFGTLRLMRCTIDLITNTPQNIDSIIETDVMAYENALEFMESITNKQPLEFMENREESETFESLLLESTPQDQRGLGFDLVEKANLPGFFTTGLLTFRKV